MPVPLAGCERPSTLLGDGDGIVPVASQRRGKVLYEARGERMPVAVAVFLPAAVAAGLLALLVAVDADEAAGEVGHGDQLFGRRGSRTR